MRRQRCLDRDDLVGNALMMALWNRGMPKGEKIRTPTILEVTNKYAFGHFRDGSVDGCPHLLTAQLMDVPIFLRS